MKKITSILVAFLAIQTSTFACSTFALSKGKELVVGNNDDWFCNVAFFVVNPRGVTKRTFLPSADPRLEWTSKYGSVTLNFNFVGSPSGGMNEAGLVIDESWPGPCRYPDPDARPAMDEIQWLQYQFDNCATVEEVLATDSKLRISGFFGKSHYFVCDSSGKVATVEWINGKMVAHVLAKDDAPVLANDNYAWSAAQLKKHAGFGGDKPIGDSTSSLDRFCRAARMVKQFATNDSSTAVDYGFEILANISQQSTAFSWIYDIANRTICYKTAQSREMKRVPLSKFDFSKGPVLMAEILTTKSGDITGNFEPYTLEKNREFVTRVIKSWRENHFAMHITEAEVEQMVQYPESQRMTSPATNAPPESQHPGFEHAPFVCDYLGETPPGDEPRVFGRGTVSVDGKNTHALEFSPDGRMLIFSRYPDGMSFQMVRAENGWSEPVRTSFTGKEVSFDATSKRLFYYDQGDLFSVGYSQNRFSEPTRLNSKINTGEAEYYPCISARGNLFFSRNSKWDQGWIMVAKRSGDDFAEPVDLGDLVNRGGASHGFVAPDESYLLFNSPRAGSFTKNDIWISFRGKDGAWMAPVNLGKRINCDAMAVLCPTVSPDGKYLFFTRLQEGGTGYVYWVSTRVIEEARIRAMPQAVKTP